MSTEKYCIGYPDTEDNLISCETASRTLRGNQCDECIKKDVLSRCTYCKGECVNTGALTYCETTPHFVYLAAFTGDFIKVGTTSVKRIKTRLLEQGANYARVIAKTPSQGLAKRIEEHVKTTFSIPDKRNKKIKLESIDPNFRTSDFIAILDRKSAEINDKQGKFSEFFLRTPQDFDFYSGYATLLRGSGITKIGIEEPRRGEKFGVEGRIVSPKGEFMILDNNNAVFAVNLGSRVGSLLTKDASKNKTQLKLL